MTGRAKKDLPNLQDSLRVSQIGKRQPSAKKPCNALVHRVEPVNPFRSAMQLPKRGKTTRTHLSRSLEVASTDYSAREFVPAHSGGTR